MEIIDLTQSYSRVFNQKEDLSVYVNSYTSFFNHYFTYWGSEKLDFARLTEKQIKEKCNLVTNSIRKVQIQLENYGIDSSSIKVILFVGQNVTNGHAFLDNDVGVAFIAIESYNTEHYSDVFCAHEISHALHYSINLEFYFNTRSEKEKLSRQLVSEGIATYMTKEILQIDDGVALWADFLTEKQITKWKQDCESKSQEIANFFYSHYDSIDLTLSRGLFYYKNLSDPFQSRGGYWLGLKLVENICQEDGLNLNKLLKIKSERIFTELKKHITTAK